jgi:hypothetical protein
MAGSSHWSLSAELSLKRLRLDFDVACRCAEMPPGLGSSYLAPQNFHLAGGEGRLLLDGISIRLQAAEGARIEKRAALAVGGCELVIVPRLPSDDDVAQGTTVRWRYTMEVSRH